MCNNSVWDFQFEEIVEKAKNFKNLPSKEEFLEFYGYYKQATVGDCNIEEPEDEEKKARYNAWKSKAGLTARLPWTDPCGRSRPRTWPSS